MAVEAETIAYVTLAVIPLALALPYYSQILYHRLDDPRKYPEARRFFTSPGGVRILNEQEARGCVRFLVDQSTAQLEIASPQLKAPVWNEQAALSLARALKKHPRLQVRVLTGPQITKDGIEKNLLYRACLQEPERVSWATLNPEAFSFLQGVCADDQLLRKTEYSAEELAPASFLSRNSAPDRYWRAAQAEKFGLEFEYLWGLAEKWPATVVRAAA